MFQQVNYETEEALNCILPAREWIEDGVLWRQKVIFHISLLNSDDFNTHDGY